LFLLTNNLNPVYFLMYTETPFCSCVLYYTFMFINGISKSLLQINCSSTSSTFQSLFILLTIHEAPAPQDSIKKSSNVASDCNRCPSDAMVLWHSANFEAATASSFSCHCHIVIKEFYYKKKLTCEFLREDINLPASAQNL